MGLFVVLCLLLVIAILLLRGIYANADSTVVGWPDGTPRQERRYAATPTKLSSGHTVIGNYIMQQQWKNGQWVDIYSRPYFTSWEF